MDFFRCCLLCSSWTALLPSQNHRGSVSDVLPLCKHGIPGRGNGRFPESRICFLARRRGVVRLSFLITVKINMRGVDINDQCRSLPGPALEKMRCFRLARSSASKKQQLRRSRSCRVIEFSNLQRVELPAASLTPSAERKPSSSVMTSWSAKSSNPQICAKTRCRNMAPAEYRLRSFGLCVCSNACSKGGQKLNPGAHIGDGQQPRHHGGDKPPVGDLHAAAEPISCCCSSRIHGKVFCFDFLW